MSNKKVCILNRETNTYSKMNRVVAKMLVDQDPRFIYVNKQVLKKFMKHDIRLVKSEKLIDGGAKHIKTIRGGREKKDVVLISFIVTHSPKYIKRKLWEKDYRNMNGLEREHIQAAIVAYN